MSRSKTAENRYEIIAEQILYGPRLPSSKGCRSAQRANLRIGSRELKLLDYLVYEYDPEQTTGKHFYHTSIFRADVSSSASSALKRMAEKGLVEQEQLGHGSSSWALTPEGYAAWQERQDQ